ncbi:MAG: MBL fold metallo-hydrolase [Bacillota bacterium]|nr:MBL fold metallo-hydrolase [Bacillota bacterium]
MKITFFGAARTVTGSCHYVEHNGIKFIVDCGLFQGNKAIKEFNYREFPFNPGELDFALLTHAHIDHSGLLPKLYKAGFKKPIYTTSATVALAEIMLPDSGYIQEMECERKNRKAARAGEPEIEPIYTAAEAMETQPLFCAKEYGESFSPGGGLTITFRDAGHILGSSIVEIDYTEDDKKQKLVFTGDLGRKEQAITEDPYLIKQADYLVMESTYGNREHHASPETDIPRFAKMINDTFYRGGNVIIPAFAVDRTQDILMLLYAIQEKKLITDCKIYVDSPLAIKATEIFAAHPSYFDKLTTEQFKVEGKAPFILDNLVYTSSAAESQQLNEVKSGAIIISASGMADAGRIKHHLKHNLWRPESSVVFFGYQAEGTLGRRLIEGETKVTIHGEEIEVKAHIFTMNGFSAHADKNEMLDWLSAFEHKPHKLFIVHGEENASLEFAELVKEKLGMDAVVPFMGDTVELLPTEAVVVAQDKDYARTVLDENLLVDINTVLQKIMVERDIEKLLRIRNYLKRIS